MARGFMAGGPIFIFLFLSLLHICCSSGTSVAITYDARETIPTSWSPRETLSLLQKNDLSTSQFRIFLMNPEAYPDSLSNTNIPIDLFVNLSESKEPLNPSTSVASWLKTYLKHLPHLNINTIVLTCSEVDVPLLLPTMNLIHSALESLGVQQRLKVAAMFSVPTLEKFLPSITEFLENTQSCVFVETFVHKTLSLGDDFLHSIVKKALDACSHLPKTRFVLYLKSSVVPSGREITDFRDRVVKSSENYPLIGERISQIYVEIKPLVDSIQKKLDLEKEMNFPTYRRGLTGKQTVTIRDTVVPVPVPSMKLSPVIITVPSTNPTIVFPTTSPITIPSTNPTTVPITVPATNPVPNPVTDPTTTPMTNPTTAPVTNPTTSPVTIPPIVPVTNPVTTPTTNPVNQPVTNPVTTYPFPPPSSVAPVGGAPSIVPVGGIPSTVPIGSTPTTGLGQSWCVAKSGVTEDALQMALDYACGIGGADCSTIQMSGICYNPNSLQAHASYAFNSYYQKNPVPTSCDFGGVAMIVATNPSTGTCTFPSSSSASSVNPASSTGGDFGPPSVTPTYGFNYGSGPPVPDANNSAGSSTVFGSDNPTGTTSSSPLSLHVGRTMLVLALTATCFNGLT